MPLERQLLTDAELWWQADFYRHRLRSIGMRYYSNKLTGSNYRSGCSVGCCYNHDCSVGMAMPVTPTPN